MGHCGAVLVAYSIANLLAVDPITPAGLGIVEATLVALSVPFGAAAYAHLRLRRTRAPPQTAKAA